MLYWIFKVILTFLYRLFFRYEVRGAENIPPEGGVIIAANHLSYLDPPLIGISIKRRATFMARDDLFGYPVIGRIVGMFSIPIDRDAPKPSTIKTAVNRLKAGAVVVMFPEGRRLRGSDTGVGKRGVGVIAALSHAYVVPALIEGTDRALPVGSRFIRPVKVRVTFGEPIREVDAGGERGYQQRVADEVMERIKGLRGTVR